MKGGCGCTLSVPAHSTIPSLRFNAICDIGLTSMNCGFSSLKFSFFKRYSIDSRLPMRSPPVDLPFPASFCCKFLWNVAEKTKVCLCCLPYNRLISSSGSSSTVSSPLSRIRRISSTSLNCPSLSNLSASSTTKNLMDLNDLESSALSLITSHSRPGVPITISALVRIRCCLCTDNPPVTVAISGAGELGSEQSAVR